MKRSDITELFPDAPKEAVDKLMGINGADVNAAKAEADGLRTQLAEIQAKLDKAPSADTVKQLQEALDKAGALETELNGLKMANQVRDIREAVSRDLGVPADLLTGGTDEECRAQAKAIIAFAKPTAYPNVRDGGSNPPPNKPTTAQQFAEWFNNQT
jgi:hypothetical protein